MEGEKGKDDDQVDIEHWTFVVFIQNLLAVSDEFIKRRFMLGCVEEEQDIENVAEVNSQLEFS